MWHHGMVNPSRKKGDGREERRACLIKRKNRGWHLGMIPESGLRPGKWSLCPVALGTAGPGLHQGPRVRNDSWLSHRPAVTSLTLRPQGFGGHCCLGCCQGLLLRSCPEKRASATSRPECTG